MIINDLDGYYIVFDTKNWNTELDTLYINIFMAKVIKKKETSKNLMIFYSFPFNFLWKSLMTLMTMTLMTGFLGLFKAVASIVLASSAAA